MSEAPFFPEHTEALTRYGGLEVHEFYADDAKSPYPVVFIPGLWETPKVYEAAAAEMAHLYGRGRHSYVFEDSSRAMAENGSGTQLITAEADLLAQAIKEKFPTYSRPVELIAHSKGVLTAVEVARKHRELVRSLILVDGAGLMGEDSLTPLMGRFTRKLAIQAGQVAINRSARKPLAIAGKEALRESVAHPIISGRRIRAIAESDLTDELSRVKDSGIPVVIMHGNRDSVFPMKKVQQMLSKDMITGFVSFGNKRARGIPKLKQAVRAGIVTGYSSETGKRVKLRGYHDDDHTNPQALIPAIDALLRTLHHEL